LAHYLYLWEATAVRQAIETAWISASVRRTFVEVLVPAASAQGELRATPPIGALVLNPSYANGWYWSGVVRNWVGQPGLALEHFATFLRLSPRERFPFYLTAIGIALFFDRQFDEAAAKLRESLQRFPNLGLTYRFLAASYAHVGRLDEAREIAEQMRALNLNVLEGGTRYRNAEYRELYLSGLRLAAGDAT
jgi:adenylate cyclase